MDDLPHGGCRGHPGRGSRTTGSAGSWQTFREYLDALDAAPHAIDVAAQVPHAALRVFAMGERGIDHAEVPTDDRDRPDGRSSRRRRSRRARVGFTTSRSRNHSASDGRITPSFSATDAELLGIAEAVGAPGKGVFEINVDTIDVERRPRAHASDLRGERAARCRSACCSARASRVTPTGGCSGASKRRAPTVWSCAARPRPDPTGLLMSLRGPGEPAGSVHRRSGRCAADATPSAAARAGACKARILAELTGDADTDRRDSRWPSSSATLRAMTGGRRSRSRSGGRGRRTRPRNSHTTSSSRAASSTCRSSNYVDGDLRARARDARASSHRARSVGRRGSLHHDRRLRLPDVPPRYWGRDAPAELRLPGRVGREAAVCRHGRARRPSRPRAWCNRAGGPISTSLILPPSVRPHPTLVDDLPGGGGRLVGRGSGYVATIVRGEVTFSTARTPERWLAAWPGSDVAPVSPPDRQQQPYELYPLRRGRRHPWPDRPPDHRQRRSPDRVPAARPRLPRRGGGRERRAGHSTDDALGRGRESRCRRPSERRQLGIHACGVWGIPDPNTLDRATVMLPELHVPAARRARHRLRRAVPDLRADGHRAAERRAAVRARPRAQPLLRRGLRRLPRPARAGRRHPDASPRRRRSPSSTTPSASSA